MYLCTYIVVVVLFYKNMGLRNRIETWSVDYLLLCSSGWAADFGGSSCLIAFIGTSHSCWKINNLFQSVFLHDP